MAKIADLAELRLELSCKEPAVIWRQAVETACNLSEIDCNLVQASDEASEGVGVW